MGCRRHRLQWCSRTRYQQPRQHHRHRHQQHRRNRYFRWIPRHVRTVLRDSDTRHHRLRTSDHHIHSHHLQLCPWNPQRRRRVQLDWTHWSRTGQAPLGVQCVVVLDTGGTGGSVVELPVHLFVVRRVPGVWQGRSDRRRRVGVCCLLQYHAIAVKDTVEVSDIIAHCNSVTNNERVRE